MVRVFKKTREIEFLEFVFALAEGEDFEETPGLVNKPNININSNSSKKKVELAYNPEELLAMTDPNEILRKNGGKRKRGRPTDIEKFFMAQLAHKSGSGGRGGPSAAHQKVKRLKSEFGFTVAQAQAFEKDIVDDDEEEEDLETKLIQVEVELDSATIMEEPEEEEENQNTSNQNQGKTTRSGRISRPPRALAASNVNKNNSSKTSTMPATTASTTATPSVGTILDPNLPPPPAPPPLHHDEPPASKRKFNVPARFRCRVCNKIYLGDRKMQKHIKSNPTHGPNERDVLLEAKAAEENKKNMQASLSMPIIPLARTQLEDLVKNLDAELVLDCVSKKMFDNFSMWDLQVKKLSLSKEKGVKRLEAMISDMETVLGEMKKLVDNCLTHTKLCDKPANFVTLGEHLQLALNSHDGPLYLEQANHIPEEFHKYFGIEPLISSPRSEGSNTLVTNPDDDDNSNSLMSAASDKDTATGSNVGLGAQMVLEQNLGALVEDDLEDDEHDHKQKRRHPSSLQDSNSKLDDSLDEGLHHHKDPVESVDKTKEQEENVNKSEENQDYQRTRLPSFSSIIAGSPKTSLADDDHDCHQLDNLNLPSTSSGSTPGAANAEKNLADPNRRLSLDHQTASLIANVQAADHLARRASIDNGLMNLNLSTTAKDVNNKALLEADENMLMSLPMTSSTTSTSLMSLETTDTKVTFSGGQPQSSQNNADAGPMSKALQNFLKADQIPAGVQSLPPSGPPSIDHRHHHHSMPSSPLATHQGNANILEAPLVQDHHQDLLATTTADDLMLMVSGHQPGGGATGNPDQNPTSSSDLQDLVSVLNYEFPSGNSQSDKLLHSIPPSSIMNVTTVATAATSAPSTTAATGPPQATVARTDFLGALGTASSSATTIASSTPAGSASAEVKDPLPTDSLSRLFDEIEAAETAAAASKQTQDDLLAKEQQQN